MAQKILTISAGGILTEVNDAYQGTVTSVAALTLGTTGTDLSSTVATGTTTPVITLQVPTASAANRGALSSADWSTFNGKQAALGFTPVNKAGDTGVGDISMGALTASHVKIGTGTDYATTGLMAFAPGTGNFAIHAVEYAGNHNIYLRPNASGYNLITSNYMVSGPYLPLSLSARENPLDFHMNTDGSATFASSVSMGALTQTVYAFASLPAGVTGMRAFVNNNSAGAAFGSAANGSGAVTYPVYHDGTSWKVG